MAEETDSIRVEHGTDRDSEAFAHRLHQIADEIESGAPLKGYTTFENVDVTDETTIAVAFEYNPLA